MQESRVSDQLGKTYLGNLIFTLAEIQIQKLTPTVLTTNRQDTVVVMQEPYMPRVSDSDREYIPC